MKRALGIRLGAGLLAPSLVGLLLMSAPMGSSVAATMEALSIDPAWAPRNTPPASAVATIRGIGFGPGTTVTFDGVAATVSYVDSRTLGVQVPTSASGKIARVRVTTGSVSDDIFPFIYTDSFCYVKPTGNDSSDCLTPGTARQTLTSALARVQTGQFPGVYPEVRVATGIYGENQLAVPGHVVLTGGWDANFTVRAPDQTVTVIDAGRAAFAMRSLGIDASVVIDGVTVRNGLRDGLGGGGIVISSDNVVVSNSVLAGNTSSSRGGAVYAVFTTSYGGTPVFSRNVMVGNRTYSNAGGAVGIYPAYSQGQVVDVAVSDNFIVGNRSIGGRGGGIGLASQAAYSYNVLAMQVVGNVVSGNRALAGGGMVFSAAGAGDHFDLLVDNNLVFNNTAIGEGGGILFSGTGRVAGQVSGSTIAGNSGGLDGGGGIRFAPGLTYESPFGATNVIAWANVNGDLTGSPLASYSDIQGGSPGPGNISVDPGFVPGPMGRFYLEQDANAMSPAVDSGGGLSSDFYMESQTTDSSLSPDAGLVDMGFHYPLGVAPSPDPIAVGRLDPGTGDLAGADWVLIRGKGFDPGAVSTFDGAPASDAIYVSSTRLLVQPPPHALGTVGVTVTNPDSSFATLAAGYQYVDNLPPEWSSTVGLQQVLRNQDCVRSAVLTWNPALDAVTPPVKYNIYRETCQPTTNNFQNPCVNTFYVPGASNYVATTDESFYVDTNFGTGGADPKIIYMIRAVDSAAPMANTEFNYSKRIVVVGKTTGDLTPPAIVGDTLTVSPTGLLDWGGGAGAVSYRVYRQALASDYGTPAALTPLVTLTTANNDLDANGITDSRYTDPALPAAEQFFFYKITALDPCSNESRSELGP